MYITYCTNGYDSGRAEMAPWGRDAEPEGVDPPESPIASPGVPCEREMAC
jgi:hypothetical protein